MFDFLVVLLHLIRASHKVLAATLVQVIALSQLDLLVQLASVLSNEVFPQFVGDPHFEAILEPFEVCQKFLNLLFPHVEALSLLRMMEVNRGPELTLSVEHVLVKLNHVAVPRVGRKGHHRVSI